MRTVRHVTLCRYVLTLSAKCKVQTKRNFHPMLICNAQCHPISVQEIYTPVQDAHVGGALHFSGLIGRRSCENLLWLMGWSFRRFERIKFSHNFTLPSLSRAPASLMSWIPRVTPPASPKFSHHSTGTSHRVVIKTEGARTPICYCWNSTVIISWYSAPRKWAIQYYRNLHV